MGRLVELSRRPENSLEFLGIHSSALNVLCALYVLNVVSKLYIHALWIVMCKLAS